MHYGFLDSTAVYPIDPSVNILETTKVLRILGYFKSPNTANLTLNAICFISLMVLHLFDSDFVPIPPALHDTTIPLTMAPNNQFKISTFPCAGGMIHILSSKGAPSPGWHLALTSATTVLECMRHTRMNIGELVSFLIQSGRAFMTHRRCDQIPLPIYRYPSPIIGSSYRSASRLPTVQEDYTYYEDIRANFLSLPRGRAALLRGGIVWRLAIEVLGDCAEDVVANGPADKAGLKNGDVVIEFNGHPVTDSRRLQLQVAATSPGATVPVQILRDGDTKTLDVTVKQIPGTEQTADANSSGSNTDTGTLNGVEVADLDQQAHDQFNVPKEVKGAVVTQVEPGSAAAEAGLKAGDVIQEINHKSIKNAEEAVKLTEKSDNKRTLVRVWENGGSHYVVVDESNKAG